jgi:sugar lactone lactonase YvrE
MSRDDPTGVVLGERAVGPLGRLGAGLRRPEGVCVAPDGGRVWASDQNGIVARIDVVSGEVRTVGGVSDRPNGIAFDRAGHLWVADVEADELIEVDPPTWSVTRRLREVGGVRFSRPNFIVVDPSDRLWVTCSTRQRDFVAAAEGRLADGYLAVVSADRRSAAVAADGLRFANGAALGPDGVTVYVAETTGRRLVCGRIDRDEVVLEPFGPPLGASPDGVAVDAAGGVWVTLVNPRQAVVRIDPAGTAMESVVEGSPGSALGHPTNLAFGGPGGTTMFVGSLDLDHIVRVDVRL